MATAAEHIQIEGLSARPAGETALQAAVRLWFLVAAAGQLLFVAHIVSFYGRAAAAGDFARWNKPLTVGYIPGDHMGNATLAVHLAMAAIITLGGLLQLIPQIRSRFATFHRWSGRLYIVNAFLASGSALYLQLLRGPNPGSVLQHAGLLINAVLIMFCAVMAFRYAMARQFETHRRWALRLFLVVSGVWFFRVGLFFWIAINGRPVGFDADKFEGPALTILSFLQYLLPLAVLELYLRAQRHGGAIRRFTVAGVLLLMTVATGIGIVGVAWFLVSSGAAV